MYPFTVIRKDSQIIVSANFKESEYFSKCPDFKVALHLFDSRLFTAVQHCRDFAGAPIYITSTFRTPECNASQGGAKNSFHLKGMAVDFYCPEYHEKLVDQIVSKGPLFNALRKSGINGFGISTKFIHLDTRPKGQISAGQGGSYDLWYY